MSRASLDAEQTWALIELLMATGEIQLIYVHRRVQHWLDRSLAGRDDDVAARRRAWLAISRYRKGRKAAGIRPLIFHARGHDDHMHVRFRCPAEQPRCRD